MIRIIIISERQRSKFSRIFGYSFLGIFFSHFSINIGMILGLFPVVGIPIVMFSYGGSSLLCASIALSVISLIIAEYRDYNQLGV